MTLFFNLTSRISSARGVLYGCQLLTILFLGVFLFCAPVHADTKYATQCNWGCYLSWSSFIYSSPEAASKDAAEASHHISLNECAQKVFTDTIVRERQGTTGVCSGYYSNHYILGS